jgi:hypothetical protein
MPRKEYSFLVDRMLGRLISWLRIFGYDTKSALELESTPKEDTLLIEIAINEGRILVSRDHVLIKRAKKAGAEAVLVLSDDVRAQLEVLLELYSLETDPNMTRCTACNSTLRKAIENDIDKIRLIEDVPENLLNDIKAFWLCDNCGKAYWQGSHWKNIMKTAEEVKNDHRKA